jgi:hypothetical protein
VTGPRGRRALTLLLLFLAGCATPRLVPLPADDPRPAALLARWRGQLGDREALRGTARLSVDAEQPHAGDLHVRSKQRVVLARPARMRVEVQGLLGTTVAVLAVDDTRYEFFEADSHRFETGPVRPDLLWNAVRLDLTPAEAVGLLLGAPELPADLRILAAHDAGEGRMRITLGGPDGRAPLRSIELDGAARLRRYAVFSEAPVPDWTAELDAYDDVGGTPLAHRVSVETRSGARAVVSLSSLELNPPLAPDIFRLERLRPASGPVTGEGG